MDLTARNQYRAWAAECKERARQGHGFKATYDWLKLANAWQRLADSGAREAIPLQTDKRRTNATQPHCGLAATEL